MNIPKNISILGAGQAGAYAASEIRKHDKEIKIKIFSDETYLCQKDLHYQNFQYNIKKL